jgi:hypothetical protein
VGAIEGLQNYDYFLQKQVVTILTIRGWRMTTLMRMHEMIMVDPASVSSKIKMENLIQLLEE